MVDLRNKERVKGKNTMEQRTHIKKTLSLHILIALLVLCFVCTGLCTGPDPCPDVPFSERERLDTCRVISRGRVSEQDARPEGCSRAFHVLFTRHFKAVPPDPVLQVSHPPGCSGSGWDRPHESVLDLEANQEYQFYLNGTDQQLHLVAAIGGRCARLPERKLAKREASPYAMQVRLEGAWQWSEARHVGDIREGTDFKLKCIASVTDLDLLHDLEWEIPDSANKTGNVKIPRITYGPDRTRLTRTAIVNEANPSDTGLYRCRLDVVKQEETSIEIRINVIGKDTKNVSLELDSPNIHVNSSEEVDSVTWILQIRAYPKPELIWRKGDKVLLNSSATPSGGGSRYSLNDTHFGDREVRLTISSPALSDVGNYTVEAAFGDGSVADRITFAFTMEVQAKVQSFRLDPSRQILRRNDRFQITCLAEGYPRPSVELRARECSRKDLCSAEEPVAGDGGASSTRLDLQLDTATEEWLEAVGTQRTWVGVAVTPAIFVCMANNSLGYNMSKPIKLLVTDTAWNVTLHLESVVDGVAQDGHNLTFVEGDSLTFTCYGNKMLTSKDLRWKLDGEGLPREGPALEGTVAVTENETDLSYITEVALPDARRKESPSELICYDEANPEVAVNKEFRIQAMQAPAWMPGVSPPEASIERSVEAELALRCMASGTPPPLVVWYKDGVRIEGNSKNMEIRDQELYFSYLLVKDSGEYKCEVRNRAGVIEAKTCVRVTHPDSPPLRFGAMVTIVSISAGALLLVVVFVCVRIYMYKRRVYALRLEDHRIFVRGSPESLNPQLGLDQQADLLPYDTKFEVPRDFIIFDQLLGSGAFGRVYLATVPNLRPGNPRTTVAVKMARSHADSTQLKALRSELKIMMHIGRHMNIVNLVGACSKHFAAKGELLLLVEYCKHGNILEYMMRHRKEFVDQISENGKADHRLRLRAGFGSGARTSSALKNAHLHFGPEAVRYHGDHSHSGETPWLNVEYGLPSAGPQTSSASCSYRYLATDMSTLTFESSLGSEEDSLLLSRSGASETSFCTRTLFLWAFQIAKGMEYLAFKKVLHGDLAARNILLTEDNVVKISDFGLAKDIYRKENYHKKSKGPMPVKWMAIECLRDGIFSTQSDVWSFGVVLWEIFSLGQNPYSGVELDETFIARVEEGVRLEQPKYATFDMYCTMRDCWAKNPLDRPSFSDLETRFGAMIGEADRQYFLELNQPYQSGNSDSVFISRLQSPDYSVKVHEGRTTGSDHSNEVPSSPGLFGAISLPASFPPANSSPTLVPRDPCGPAGNYLTMSSITLGHSERPRTEFKAETDDRGTTLGCEGLGGHSASGQEEEICSRYSQSYTCLHNTVTGLGSEPNERSTGLDDVPAMQNNPGYYQNVFLKSKERRGLTTGGARCQETRV
ncbi:vascular endothelial growth factor receptor 1-like [Penaeus chinensis]|uniref:vascular endothelial growth factor receptor 1-like n=1 Tax=Penaeus chinensis TaxID=139456 RepID=UPI001FB570D0|nr:vascular endothelial growth factor receptor 1-like [Penaeus chinensis]